MARHIKETCHGPVTSPNKCATKVTLHKRKVCMKLLLCDVHIIKYHVRYHKMTICGYKKRHGIHIENMLEQYRLKVCTAIQNSVAFQPKELLKSNFNPNLLAFTQTTNDTGNLTLFKCLICRKSFQSSSLHYAHQREKHGNRSKVKLEQHVLEARFHNCNICNKKMLCDNAIVYNHVFGSHNINFTEYVNNFVIKNGHRNIPTFKAYKYNQQVFETIEMSTEHNEKQDKKSGFILPEELSSESEDSDEGR